MIALALDAITSFSTAPIRIVHVAGVSSLVIFCVGFLAWTVYVKLFTDTAVAGWTSLLAVVLLLGGHAVRCASGSSASTSRASSKKAKQRARLYLVSETRGRWGVPARRHTGGLRRPPRTTAP